MERKIFMWVVIGMLFLAMLFLTFKLGAEKSSTGQIDTTSWTENEIMNYEMHGTIPARAQSNAPNSPAGAGMVGGC